MRNRGRAATALAAALLLGACAGLLVGACGGGSADEPESDPSRPPDILVKAKEFRFEPAEVLIDAGRPSVVAVENIGSIPHDLTVKDGGFKVAVAKGATRRKALTVAKAGTYKFYCSLPGHESAGMRGTLTAS
jgi:plastocyanin